MAPPRNTPLPKAEQRAARRWGLAPRTDLERLRAAQQADIEAGERFDGTLTRGWVSRKLRAWTKRLDRMSKRAEALLKFGTALAAFLGVSAKVWHYIADRRVPPAELPATGEPTVGTDFVKKPKPPGG